MDKKTYGVGPVEMSKDILKCGGEQLPYFRTQEFSNVTNYCIDKLKEFAKAPAESELIILTASGTGAMEGTVINTLNNNDKVLIINSGSFGQRFCDICEVHQINYDMLRVDGLHPVTYEVLKGYKNKGYTAFCVNMDETSIGLLHDMTGIGKFCKEEGIFLIVDAIGSFLADELDMKAYGINALIFSSQKALALPPGLSFVILDKQAQERISNIEVKSFYFDFKKYICDSKRGQTPFTPAVGIILQLQKQLQHIERIGVENYIKRTEKIAKDFRDKIVKTNYKVYGEYLSNAVTPLIPPKGVNPYNVFKVLMDKYNIYVCPNGGALAEYIFRVGHLGELTEEDNDTLIQYLVEIEDMEGKM